MFYLFILIILNLVTVSFLFINLKKDKTEVMLFGTAKRLSLFHGRQLNLTVNGSFINSTTAYKYLGVHLDPTMNLEMHFNKTYKKAAGRVNLLRRIRSSIGLLNAERIYRAMIMPVFTYCGTTGLGWSDTNKRLIGNIERRSLAIIAPNSSNHSADLRIPSVDSILKWNACLFVFVFMVMCATLSKTIS